MDLIIINNSGFIKANNNYYISKTTGQFIANYKNLYNNKISLLQFEEDGDIKKGINDYQVEKDIQIETVPFSNGIKKISSYLLATLQIIKTIHKTKSFIYIFYPGHFSLIVAFACIWFKKSFGLYVRGEYNSTLSKPIFRHASFINTIGIVFQRDIKKINNNCHLIRPMVQFNFFEKPNDVTVEKLDEILFVGRIEKRKGIWEIVKAAKKIEEKHPNYTFRLIGAGQDFDEINSYIETNNLSNIILHGAVFNPDELKHYYLQSKIFLFPSYDEGFPRVLYEAMYFKLPIITTFVGNIPGIMQNNYNCLKIESRSVNSIVSQVDKLISDAQLSKQLTENGEKTLSLIFNDNIIDHSKLLMKQLKDYEQQGMES